MVVVATSTSTAPKPSAWTPLQTPVYRNLWIAGLVSNVGSAMHGVAAGWVVTSLTKSPSIVSLLAAATALPSFLLALPAGALADVIDRRRLLLISQILMAGVAVALGIASLGGSLTVALLVGLTMALSVGGTLNMPNWVALAPELLPREQLANAGALNAISMNAAGALGPALGGIVLAAAGAGWVFIVNAVSFLAVIVAVYQWKRVSPATTLPAEHVSAAVRTGIRYVANQPTMLLLMVRIAAIAVSATALGALLPVVARREVGVTAGQFGLLGASMGVTAVGVATVLPRLRDRLGVDRLALLGGIVLAAGLATVGVANSLIVLMLGAALSGAGQIAAFSTTFSVVQAILPGWVRGRGLATAMLAFQGTSMVAALSWGAIAGATGAGTAMISAGATAAVLAVAAYPLRLGGRAEVDLTPMPIAALHHVIPIDPDDGPVLVSITWNIDPSRRDGFVAAMNPIRRLRRRDGAMQWGLFEDVDEPGKFVEQFTVSTWAEHERQHERPTAADAEVTACAQTFLANGATLHGHHRIAAHVKRRGRSAR
jgi:MFS family permease